MDDCGGADNPVVAGVCKQLYNGRVYPCFAGDSNYRRVDQGHPGPEAPLADGRS